MDLLDDHGDNRLALTGGKTQDHARCKMPFKAFGRGAEDRGNDQYNSRAKHHAAPADGDGERHANQISYAPAQTSQSIEYHSRPHSEG
jgi:hypothetical protein